MTNSIQKEDSPENNNKVFVGVKHFLNYIKSITFQFTKSENDEVTIIARGKQITKAVDLAEVMKKKQVDGKNISVKKIKIGSESKKSDTGKIINVSTIEITLTKTNP